jgi:hypothetical protein
MWLNSSRGKEGKEGKEVSNPITTTEPGLIDDSPFKRSPKFMNLLEYFSTASSPP